MPTLLDADLILYKYLTSVTALCTAVGHVAGTTQRIYGPPLGIPSGITAPTKLICFSSDGGSGNADVPMASDRFTFYVYGTTQSEARSVARSLHDALHRIGNQRVTLATGSIALLRRAELEMGLTDLPEPQTNWPRVVCAYRVTYCEWSFAA
jgi:hypothetical protein